jgi:hypothetical protein
LAECAAYIAQAGICNPDHRCLPQMTQKQSCMVEVPCNVDRSFVGGIKLVGEMEIWWHMRAAKDRTHACDLSVCLLYATGHFTDKSREGDVLNLGHYRNA